MTFIVCKDQVARPRSRLSIRLPGRCGWHTARTRILAWLTPRGLKNRGFNLLIIVDFQRPVHLSAGELHSNRQQVMLRLRLALALFRLLLALGPQSHKFLWSLLSRLAHSLVRAPRVLSEIRSRRALQILFRRFRQGRKWPCRSAFGVACIFASTQSSSRLETPWPCRYLIRLPQCFAIMTPVQLHTFEQR